MLNPSDFIKRNGIWIPQANFANPLGMWQVRESGCCGEAGPPPSCEDTGKSICYVDKYAAGAGDGTSWTDAYTTIQAAITGYGTIRRIYVQGYGKADPYSEALTCGNSLNLVGVGDVWVSGKLDIGIRCCFYKINATGSTGQFYAYSSSSGLGNKYVLCSVEDSSAEYGFYEEQYSTTTFALYISCTVNNLSNSSSVIGFADFQERSTCTDCIVTNLTSTGYGAHGFAGMTCDGCLADTITCNVGDASGFILGYATSCTAQNITGGYNAYGFENVHESTDCFAITVFGATAYGYHSTAGYKTCTDCVASEIRGGRGGIAEGFYNVTCVDCVADDIYHAPTYGLAVGFKSCTNTNSTCTDPQPEDGCIVA